ERVPVIPWGGEHLSQVRNGGIRSGLEKAEAEAQREPRQGEHPPELSASENSDHGRLRAPGIQRAVRHGEGTDGSGSRSTASVRAARYCRSRSRRSGSSRARMEAARSAALIAPARPMARVPT